ncbi:hypothetical protein [Chitinimonas sp. JJ19]|uniref:hypothetical protein n=1 Tax=Chitinimonas sp. JJ19 TaxID=3109352 RepID=UPI0030030BA6
MPDEDNLLSGAGSIMKSSTEADGAISTEGFEEIDLGLLLKNYGLDKPAEIGALLPAQNENYKYRRNDLQERLITASNQRCSAYIRTIVSSKSQTQMGWTGLSTLLSGAAAVVPHALTAKALAAGSTVSTGLLSTYNEVYFNNLAVTVISAGISKQRASILASINQFQSRPLSQYSVNAAIADALAYHAACNIVSGMEAAAKATSGADTAGFSPLNR